jgi:hypothetical protein
MRATITYFYDADPAHYPEGSTPQQMTDIGNNADMAETVASLGELVIEPEPQS